MPLSVYFHPIYWVLRFFSILPTPALHFFARCTAYLMWRNGSEMARVTKINIRHCYPQLSEAEQMALAEQSLIHTAFTAFEMPKAMLESPAKSAARISKVTGKEHLDALQENGNGVVLLAPHLGNWEYLGLTLPAGSLCLYKPSKKAVINDIVCHGRGKAGSQPVPTDKRGVLAVVKGLRSGGMSGILPDQVPEQAGSRVMAEFMRQPAPTMTLITKLVSRPNVKVIAGFAKRLADGTFEIIYQPVPDDIYSDDVQVSARALNQAVESLIELAPEQYQWEYKRFRYDEKGKTRLYKK